MTHKPTDPRAARWMRMIESGKSYGQIAKEDGVSRSTVAGAIHRMVGRAPTMKYYAERPPKFMPTLTLPSFADVLAADSCRYITGDPRSGPAIYCGHPRADGSSFCSAHHKICYRPPSSITAPDDHRGTGDDLDKKLEGLSGTDKNAPHHAARGS